jgi:hypothetical protein
MRSSLVERCVLTHAYAYVCMYAVYVCVILRMRSLLVERCVCMHVYVYVCMYAVYVYVCVYIYIVVFVYTYVRSLLSRESL